MKPRLRILHLEDNAYDLELIAAELQEEGFNFERVVVEKGAEFEQALDAGCFDLILSDHTVPGYSGIAALAAATAKRPNVPFILVSGTLGEEQAVDSLLAGATDYVLKGRLARLGPAVRRAMKEAEELSQRRRVEAQLRQSQELFQLTLKSASIMAFSQDRDLRYTWVHNPQFGSTAEESLGKTDAELMPGAESARLMELKRRVIERGVGICEEAQLKSGAGKARHYHLTVEPLRDAVGDVIGLTGAALDITDKKENETRFLRAQRLESIGALASGIAHDLNNILAPVMMSTPLMRCGLTPEEFETTVAAIETSARRGAELIKQLLIFGRGVEGKRVALEPQHLIREVLQMAGETFPKAIKIQCNLPAGLWQIMADVTQIHQVLLNLCVNARDAMPDGGTLTLTAENIGLDDQQAHMFPDAKPGPYLLVRVTDTGTGIPAEVLERIFDPFFTTKPPGKGTGLGLSTVLGILRSHGGFMDLKSEIGSGTTFAIYFPASPAMTPTVADLVPGQAHAGHGETVLVVDDELQILDVTKKTLEKHGYHVFVAEDGMAAMACFREHHREIQAVLTDLDMPSLDGVGLVRALRTIDPATPVGVCSGIGSERSLEEKKAVLRQLGVETFLSKPYAAPTLIIALQEILRASEPRRGRGRLDERVPSTLNPVLVNL